VTQKTQALKDAVQANNQSDVERCQSELSASLQKVGQAVYQNAAPPTSDGGSEGGGDDIPPQAGAGEAPPGADGDVVDAEFKEV
ncbi:MAG: hypothetical protein ACREOL_10115, partial [Candidatus Dormibacteria bacterium]